MNFLIDKFPTSVLVGERDIPIKWDLATAIEFERILKSNEDDILKMAMALELYFPDMPSIDAEDGIKALLQFYSMDIEYDSGLVNPKKGRGGSDKVVTDFDYDSRYIYAAFIEQYGIDLQKETMHWWKFRTLLDGLNEKVFYSKILHWRNVKLTDIPEEQRPFYKEMKEIYALPSMSKAEYEEIERLNEILNNGGDINFDSSF